MTVRTWVRSIAPASSVRAYVRGTEVILRANGAPCRIPDELVGAFALHDG